MSRWLPTGFDGVRYGGSIGTLGSTSVPDRTIGWSCSSEGLHLELDLPARDAGRQSAGDVLAGVLSGLPWWGVDVEGDGMGLKQNLRNQVEAYKKASDAENGLKAILYFSEAELERVEKVVEELGLAGDSDIILIDARADNEPSASNMS